MKKNTRHEIINNFAILVAQKEIHEISIRDIAKLCNLTPASIYKHFDSKKELIIELFSSSAQKLQENVKVNFTDIKSAKQTFINLFLYAQENPHVFKLLLNLNQCVEINSIEVSNLIENNCVIRKKLYELNNSHVMLEYLVLYPFMKYSLENANLENAKIFIDQLIKIQGEIIWT